MDRVQSVGDDCDIFGGISVLGLKPWPWKQYVESLEAQLKAILLSVNYLES